MMPRDANGNAVQTLHPVDGSLQRLAPTVGTAGRSAAFGGLTRVVGVRNRSGTGIGHVRFGNGVVIATVADLTLTIDDGWMFFSIDALAADGSAKPIAYVSVYAEGGPVNADIVELS